MAKVGSSIWQSLRARFVFPRDFPGFCTYMTAALASLNGTAPEGVTGSAAPRGRRQSWPHD